MRYSCHMRIAGEIVNYGSAAADQRPRHKSVFLGRLSRGIPRVQINASRRPRVRLGGQGAGSLQIGAPWSRNRRRTNNAPHTDPFPHSLGPSRREAFWWLTVAFGEHRTRAAEARGRFDRLGLPPVRFTMALQHLIRCSLGVASCHNWCLL